MKCLILQTASVCPDVLITVNGKKDSNRTQGEQYMLKFPPSGQGKRTELSYTNSCISEHIASTIFNMVGIPAQETILGTYDVGGKTKIVCACKDFTADGSKLFDFCSIKNTVIDSEYGGTGTELEDILDTIEKQQYVNPVEVLQHFWNVILWWMRFWGILTDTTETGDSCITMTPRPQRWPQSMIAAAVCCRRQMPR